MNRSDAFISLLVDPNNGCNLNCIHCGLSCSHLVHFSKQETMPPEKFGQMLERLGSYIKSFAVGCIREPLVHPRIGDILMRADRAFSKTTALSLSTNGILLNDSLCAFFIRADHEWSFNISIESAHPDRYETIRRGAQFDVFDRNLKNLCSIKTVRPGLKIFFSTVVMKTNLYDLETVFDYAGASGIDGVTLMDLEPHAHNHNLMLTPEEKEAWQGRVRQFQEGRPGEKMSVGIRAESSPKNEITAVMNQKGEVYPPGHRSPVGNIFNPNGLRTILNHYQITSPSGKEKG